MIVYDNRDVLRGILLQTTGSVIYSIPVLVPSVLSTVMCAVMMAIPDMRDLFLISDSMARIYATIIGFVIVMRTTLAFGRFFEGIETVTVMFSKWRDAYVTTVCFIEASIEGYQEQGNAEIVDQLLDAKGRLMHWFSLLAALAVQRMQAFDEDEMQAREYSDADSKLFPHMRMQPDVFNSLWQNPLNKHEQDVQSQSEFQSEADKPASPAVSFPVSPATSAMTQQEESGEIADERARATRRASPNWEMRTSRSSRASVGPSMRQSLSQKDPAAAAARPLWSSQVEFGIDTRRYAKNRRSSINATPQLLRGDTQGSTGSNLITRATQGAFFETPDKTDTRVRVVGCLSPSEEWLMSHSTDMVHTVFKWILFELSHLSISKKLLIAPPILARVYQELSSGMLGYFMACKIADVPFPFPFAQFLQYALYAFFLFCPFLVLENMGNYELQFTWLCLPINFLACAGFAALNEISIELEEPFGTDENDYPIHIQQWTVAQAMEDAFFQAQPKDFDLSCFGEAEGTLEAEIERRVVQASSMVGARKAAPEKVAASASSAALGEKFDELRSTILAATRWLQQHRSDRDSVMPDQERLNKLAQALQKMPREATDFLVPGNEGTDWPMHDSLHHSGAVKDAFREAFGLDAPVARVTRNNNDAPTGEALSAALQEIIDSSSDPVLKEELRVLVQQHATAANILELAMQECPEVLGHLEPRSESEPARSEGRAWISEES